MPEQRNESSAALTLRLSPFRRLHGLCDVIRRRELAAELLAEHDREEWEYLTTDPGAWREAFSRFSAYHNSKPPGTGARAWREAVEAKMDRYPE